jgi:hypothetical protein
MSRGTAARRRRDDGEAWRAESFRVTSELDELRERGEEFEDENAQLKERVAELEGWYRLLQAEHVTLQADAARAGRRVTELQTEANRLAAENQGLHELVPSRNAAGTRNEPRRNASMIRVVNFVKAVQKHRWAAAAVLAVATLLARDSAVRGAFGSAYERVRQAIGGREDSARGAADSGFLRYAAMVNSRDQAERARQEYNRSEAKLKGDALLEAQDRLRAAKARHLQARLAFLPELARRCQEASVPLPKDAAEALAELKQDATK